MHHSSKVSQPNVVAIILARSQSKRLPNKNLQRLGGRTLLEWIISAAKNSKAIDDVFVSTDSTLYADIATNAMVNTIIRPPELATDEATSQSGVSHALRFIDEKLGLHPEVALLMQPTTPLTSPETVRKAVKAVRDEGYDTALSVSIAKKKPFWALVKRGDTIVPFMTLPKDSPYAG